METFLTIALPTYNRAPLLARQLDWLQRAIQGYEDLCEILLSDNCSTDETGEVLRRWQDTVTGPRIRVRRHPSNIGAVRNIVSCIRDATGRFVWTISDDDTIDDEAVGVVLDWLQHHPDLAVLMLNFSHRSGQTGQLLYDRCFDVDDKEVWDNGREAFEQFLRPRHPARWGGLSLTTALVYRTSHAHDALQRWPDGLGNLNLQLFVTGYCAAVGKTVVTRETHLECLGGTHHFMEDDRVFLRFVVAEYAESFARLVDLGYERRLCRRKILEQPSYVGRRLLARCGIRHPIFTAKVLGRWLRALWRVTKPL